MEPITMYTTGWCPDCRRARTFLKERGVSFQEINIEEDASAEAIVTRVNDGRTVVPTFDVDGRYFACSPFNAEKLAAELHIPLNP